MRQLRGEELYEAYTTGAFVEDWTLQEEIDEEERLWNEYLDVVEDLYPKVIEVVENRDIEAEIAEGEQLIENYKELLLSGGITDLTFDRSHFYAVPDSYGDVDFEYSHTTHENKVLDEQAINRMLERADLAERNLQALRAYHEQVCDYMYSDWEAIQARSGAAPQMVELFNEDENDDHSLGKSLFSGIGLMFKSTDRYYISAFDRQCVYPDMGSHVHDVEVHGPQEANWNAILDRFSEIFSAADFRGALKDAAYSGFEAYKAWSRYQEDFKNERRLRAEYFPQAKEEHQLSVASDNAADIVERYNTQGSLPIADMANALELVAPNYSTDDVTCIGHVYFGDVKLGTIYKEASEEECWDCSEYDHRRGGCDTFGCVERAQEEITGTTSYGHGLLSGLLDGLYDTNEVDTLINLDQAIDEIEYVLNDDVIEAGAFFERA